MSQESVRVRTGEEGPPIPTRELFRRLGALAWSHRLIALPAVLATVAFQALTLAGLAGQGLAIDVIRSHFAPDAPDPKWPLGLAPGEDWGIAHKVAAVGAAVALFSILAGAARFFTRYFDERFVQACVVDLRQKLYEKLQRLPFGFFDSADTGQIINRVTADSQHVRGFIQGVMIRAGIAAITLAIFLGYMFNTHALLAFVCFAVFPLQVMVMARLSLKTKPRHLEQSAQNDVVIKALTESIAGIRVIRVFGREHERRDLFSQLCRKLQTISLGIASTQSRHVPFVQASNIFAQAALLGLGGWLVLRNQRDPAHLAGIGLGTLWVFRGLLDRLAWQAEAIVSIIGETPEALAGAERVFKLLDQKVMETADRGPDSAGAAVRPGASTGLDVEFRGVTFGYDPGRPVLHQVSFKVRAGETIAIVGPTGCGKSTLLSLIPRFYDPQNGQVLVGGIDVRRWPLEDLRRSIACVFQEPFLFSHTIAANVAFGAPDARDEVVHAALETASAEAFVDELALREKTIIGERGVSLSGGQRQRLTLARALLVDPAVLILDDATGSVDAITESEIQSAMERVMRGRTTFIVAHRLSTLRRADRIVVLEHGRIVDVGSHHELMERGGHYRASALIQLALDDAGSPDDARPPEGGLTRS